MENMIFIIFDLIGFPNSSGKIPEILLTDYSFYVIYYLCYVSYYVINLRTIDDSKNDSEKSFRLLNLEN